MGQGLTERDATGTTSTTPGRGVGTDLQAYVGWGVGGGLGGGGAWRLPTTANHCRRVPPSFVQPLSGSATVVVVVVVIVVVVAIVIVVVAAVVIVVVIVVVVVIIIVVIIIVIILITLTPGTSTCSGAAVVSGPAGSVSGAAAPR